MNNAASSLLILILAALISAVIAWSFSSDPTDLPPRHSSTTDQQVVDGLRQEIGRLEERITELQGLVRAADVTLPTEEIRREEIAPIDAVTRAEFNALLAQLEREGAISPSRGPATGHPPTPQGSGFESRVADALKALERDRVAAKQQAIAGNVEVRLDNLRQKLSLDPRQTDAMRTLLVARDARNQEIVQLWQAGVDDAVLGETKRTHAETFRTSLQQVLTPEQLDLYQGSRAGAGGK